MGLYGTSAAGGTSADGFSQHDNTEVPMSQEASIPDLETDTKAKSLVQNSSVETPALGPTTVKP